MATAFDIQVDVEFGTSPNGLWLAAWQGKAKLDEVTATVTNAGGIYIASGTLNLASATDGTVFITVREKTTDIVAAQSTVVASAGEGEADGTQILLQEIKAKTDLIGTGSATIAAPVTEAGNIERIVRGADYKSVNARAFSWTFTNPGNIASLGSAVCTFAGQNRTDAAERWSVNGTLSSASNGNVTATFELNDTDTANLSLGEYEWSVEVIDDSGNKIVPVVTDRERLTRLVQKFS